MSKLSNLFRFNKAASATRPTKTATNAMHTYRVVGVSGAGRRMETTIKARSEDDARTRIMKSSYQDVAGYLNNDGRDYGVHFIGINYVARVD